MTESANDFIDSLGLECGDELKLRLGEKGWEFAKELQDRIATLEAENTRLRTALDLMAQEMCEHYDRDYCPLDRDGGSDHSECWKDWALKGRD
jgi:hypothetical protein